MPAPDPENWPRIRDLTVLEPENFKYRNTQFLQDDSQPYDAGQGRPEDELRRQIWNVRNGDIQQVLAKFPTDEPVREQCALWVHAVAGKHFFPDANHRTAVALLRQLLDANEIDYRPWSIDRLREARADSHRVRRAIEPVRLDTLYRRDELYEVWLVFFEDELEVHVPDDG